MVEENTAEPGERKQRRDRAGYTVNELRQLVQEGIDSGPQPAGDDRRRQS